MSSENAFNIIDQGPYGGFFLNTYDTICLRGIRVFSYSFDLFLACFISTSRDSKKQLQRYLYVTLAFPFWGLCTLLTLPIAALFIILWLPICRFRKPYRFSFVENHPVLEKNLKTRYTCVTSNVCVMHEVLTRFNNQQNTRQKARQVGARIATQQLGLEKEFRALSQAGISDNEVRKLRDDQLRNMGVGCCAEENQTSKANGELNRKRKQHSTDVTTNENNATKPSGAQFNNSVLKEFPDVDFICFQETWNIWYISDLIKELHRVFPYIVYDAGVDSLSSNMFLLNSGTMIVSRYPIIDIDFNYYKCSHKQCKLASKGLLQAKVYLGKTPDGKRAVGYLANTHLQAYQGTYPVHTKQMDDIVQWTNNFRSRKPLQNEVIAFDVIGGDFNVDNMSPVDKAVRYHPLFNVYKDVCRKKPGEDYEWARGTELRHTPLDDPLIQTPLGLQLTLQNSYLMQQYVLSADISNSVLQMAYTMPERDQHGKVVLSAVGGKRRIDCVLYRTGDGVKVTSCNAVSQLAGLTDHIPYSLTFDVNI